MLQPIGPAARGLAAATVFTALLLASPLHAATSDAPPIGAQLAQAAPPAAAPKKPRPSPVDRIEQRIKSLHAALQITPDQEPQWNAVAQAMREQGQMTGQAIQQRAANPAMNAVDELKAYEAIVDAHAQGLQKLVPAFQALYASLSDDQKKKADVLFSHTPHRRHGAKS
ncbi:MAG TPA: Spy/CpxP family protein refolding chaperone [Stellaceae bacterium]|nr:Spy/CpxP family protein refolding chaperone [Stellaceae bacterium]